MFRLLLAIVAIVVVVLIAKRLLSQSKPGRPPARAQSGKDMVRCAHCGLHIPASEAIRADGKTYCSDEHRLADHSDPNA